MNMVNPCWRQVNQVCIMIPAVYCRSAYTLSHFNSINNTPSPPIGTLHPTAPWPHSYLIMSMYFFANFKNLEYGFLLFFWCLDSLPVCCFFTMKVTLTSFGYIQLHVFSNPPFLPMSTEWHFTWTCKFDIGLNK